jgi:hypothetical protein
VRKTKLLSFLAIGAVSTTLAGCGGMASEAAPAGGETTASTAGMEQPEPMLAEPTLEEREIVASYETDIEQITTDFETKMTLSTGPDCDAAGGLRDQICDLSERICDIAERHSSWSDVQTRCEDARQRCESATERVADDCR